MSQQDSSDEPNESPQPAPQGDRFARLRAFWAQPTTRFALLFFLYLFAIALSYPAIRIRLTPTIEAAEDLTADIVYAMMSPLSDEVHISDEKALSYGRFGVIIVEECTGLYEALLLAAALLAFPTTWKKALIGFAMGFPMIYALNILRICMLLIVGHFGSEHFEFLHVYFWQVTMVLMVASTWLVWVIWVVGSDYGRPASTRD